MSLQYQLNVQSDEDYFTTAMELNPFFREQSLYIFDMSWIKDSNRFEAFRNGYFSGKYRFFS